ncbi:MAG: PEP-CTERM sorting domain-containing protein [Phycisphaerae bacterium]
MKWSKLAVCLMVVVCATASLGAANSLADPDFDSADLGSSPWNSDPGSGSNWSIYADNSGNPGSTTCAALSHGNQGVWQSVAGDGDTLNDMLNVSLDVKRGPQSNNNADKVTLVLKAKNGAPFTEANKDNAGVIAWEDNLEVTAGTDWSTGEWLAIAVGADYDWYLVEIWADVPSVEAGTPRNPIPEPDHTASSARVDNVSFEFVPEPTTLALLALGGLVSLRRKR